MHSLRHYAKWYLLGILFLSNAFIWYAIFAETRSGVLTVAFLDVGQGDAVFIEAPNGNQMLIDGGPSAVVLRTLGEVMPFYDRSIDVVLATHPDKDHIGGLPAVFDRYAVSYFFESGVSGTTAAYRALLDAVRAEGIGSSVARRGVAIDLGSGVVFEILFPDRDPTGMDTNDASVVAKVVYGGTSFLLTGDSPQRIEQYLAALDGAKLKTDVLKVGHHGSKTSSADAFLGFASPLHAVISSGAENQYGHPHREVLDRLARFGIAVARTDKSGTVRFSSDGAALSRVQ